MSPEGKLDTIVDVGLMLRKYILVQQMPVSGSFSSLCLSEPVAKPLLILLDVMFEGSRCIAQEEKDDPASISAKVRVACAVSELTCSNATKHCSNAQTLY